MHVILDCIESHDLLHVERLRQITRLKRGVQHARVTKHHLWGRAARDEELLLLRLRLQMRRWHRDSRLLLRGLLA